MWLRDIFWTAAVYLVKVLHIAIVCGVPGIRPSDD